MAGFSGVYRVNASDESSERTFREALGSMLHTQDARSRVCLQADGLLIGAVFRENGVRTLDTYESDNWFMGIYGEIREEGSDRPLTAKMLAERVQTQGVGAFDTFYGSYQVVGVNRNHGKLVVQNDRQGSLPLFYHVDGSVFSFAPEAKGVLKTANVNPELSVTSAASFLREGFPLTGDSMFAGISRLKPGHRIVLDMQSLKIDVQPYWRLSFDGAQDDSLRTNAKRLYDLIVRAHEKSTGDSPENFGLFLTGGIDSRGMAGALNAIGRLPKTSLTWCGKTRISNSDPDVAAKIAGYYGFPHLIVSMDGDALSERAGQWIRIGELTTDNTGFFTSSVDAFQVQETEGIPYFLVGDELFGHGGDARTEMEAISYMLKSAGYSANAWLRRCVRSDAVEEVDCAFTNGIRQVIDSLNRKTPRNIVDALTYYVHRPCWSYSAGNCKEPGVMVKRPFMDDELVAFCTGLSEAHRNDKTVYFEMLRRHMPETLRFPRATADSLFDWPTRFRSYPRTREYLLGALNADLLFEGSLKGILDPDRTREFVSDYFSATGGETPSRVYGHYLVNIRRFLSKSKMTRAGAQKLSGWLKQSSGPTRVNPTHLIRRLALLSLFLEEIESGSFN